MGHHLEQEVPSLVGEKKYASSLGCVQHFEPCELQLTQREPGVRQDLRNDQLRRPRAHHATGFAVGILIGSRRAAFARRILRERSMQIFADMLISCSMACQRRSRSLLSPAGFVREVDAALAWAKTDAESTLRRGYAPARALSGSFGSTMDRTWPAAKVLRRRSVGGAGTTMETTLHWGNPAELPLTGRYPALYNRRLPFLARGGKIEFPARDMKTRPWSSISDLERLYAEPTQSRVNVTALLSPRRGEHRNSQLNLGS